jgi:CBS domain-containing protein
MRTAPTEAWVPVRTRRRHRIPPSVASLMKPDPPSASSGDSLTDVANRMRSSRVSAVAVMEDVRLVGIITERDLVRAVAEGLDPRTTAVSDCMTQSPHTIAAHEPASMAAERMIELGVRHLPVMRDDRVVGVVSARDLLHLGRPLPLGLLSYEPW